MKYALLLLIVVFSLSSETKAQEISPWLFGQNHWMDKTDEGKRPGYLYMLWPKVGASNIKMVRIGGGGYEHHFPDQKTLSAMVDSIRGIGAEPLLQVPRDYTKSEVTKLVKEFKYSNGKGVRFYSIGNEPLLRNRSTIEKVYDYVKRLAPAMKAADPTIKIFIFDGASLRKGDYQRICGGDLDLTGKDKNGNWMIDGITFHNYPNGADFNRNDVVFSGPYKIRNQIEQLVEMIKTAEKKNGRTGQSKLFWGLTETNVTYVNPNREISGFGNPSFLGGQFIAEMYGLGLQYGAFTVCPWCISETDRVKTDFGYLGLPSEFYPRSSYYHTQMMAVNMNGAFLPTKSNNSYVKTIGSKSDSTLCIMIMNEDQTHDFDFDLFLNKNGQSAKSLLISADAGLNKTISGTIPNQTTLMFVLSKTGEIIRQYTYGLTQNLQHLPPEIKINGSRLPNDIK